MNESRFLRWARVVADFGSPFYREERQRDVWNEASALGFQAGVWLTLLAATVAASRVSQTPDWKPRAEASFQTSRWRSSR